MFGGAQPSRALKRQAAEEAPLWLEVLLDMSHGGNSRGQKVCCGLGVDAALSTTVVRELRGVARPARSFTASAWPLGRWARVAGPGLAGARWALC